MRTLLTLAVAGLLLALAPAVKAEPARYAVTPVMDGGRLAALDVSVAFAGDRDGVTDITLPDYWLGARDLDRAIGAVRAEGATVSRDGVRLRLRHPRGAAVRLTYRLEPEDEAAPGAGGARPYRPALWPEGFTAVGWTLLPRIEGREADPARFSWGAAPAGWTLASDLDHVNGGDIVPADLLDSVLIGGRDLRLVERETAGGRVRLAVHGDWTFAPEAMADLFARVADAASAFWDEPGGSVLVALTPLHAPAGVRSQFGAGLGDGFALWVTPNMPLADLRHILAHEHLHAWFPERLGGVRRGPDEPLDFWLSEGFTEFFTLRLLVRAGLMTPEEHAASLNRILQRYARSPARDWTNARMARAFWDEAPAADLPYQRGLLLALVLDARLRRESGGALDLDDVVLAMREGRGRAPDRLRTAWRRLAGSDLGADVARHIDSGEPIDLPPDLFGACAAVVTREERLPTLAVAALPDTDRETSAAPRGAARLLARERGAETGAGGGTAAILRVQAVAPSPAAPAGACATALAGAPGI